MRIATLTLAAALAAPAAGLASEAPLPGPAAGWGMSEAWRESIARSLGALRAESANGVPRLSAELPDSFDDERRIRVRASSSFSPRIAMSLPAWVAADGGAGIDLSAQARRPRAGQHANGIADRTLWSTSAEGWGTCTVLATARRAAASKEGSPLVFFTSNPFTIPWPSMVTETSTLSLELVEMVEKLGKMARFTASP